MLALSWAGAYLRNPATLGSFSGRPGMTRQVAAESEPAVPRLAPGLHAGHVFGLTSLEFG
jgi:hypothetical protein